jgi:hypothetical protein
MKPHLPPQPQLSSEQKQLAWNAAQFVEQTNKALAVAESTIEMRKWCVEQAVRYAHVAPNVVAEARLIYDFVTEPLRTAMSGIEAMAKEKDRQG